MHSFWKLTWTESKLYFRFPVMAFFTLVMPVMLIVSSAVAIKVFRWE